MEIAQLISNGLIILGIFYVAFIQDRVTKIKDRLFETLKDYPEAAEAFIKMERTKIEVEVRKKSLEELKEVLGEIQVVNKEDFQKVASEYARFIVKIFGAVGHDSLLEKYIEEIEHDVLKNAIKEAYSLVEK